MNKLTSCALGLALSAAAPAAFAQPKVMISQIYGGAGCGTTNCSTYKNDYIEIFNAGNAPQSLNGWSIQYTAATGTAWQSTNLTNVSLQPGQYYLIAQGAGSNGANNIPTPDVSGVIAISATACKVALVSNTTLLSGSCPLATNPAIVDFVGVGGTANCREGSGNAPSPSTTTSIFRAANGCTDAGDNSTDFSVGTPNARNSSITVTPCPASLPVTFTAFRAQYQEAAGSVLLSWSTAQERNASEFIAERSADGRSWSSIRRVPAAGNTSLAMHYQATDDRVLPGINLYRIRQVDLDGQAQYTATISVNAVSKPAAAALQVYPNPATGKVYISAALPAGSAAGIRVTDMSGRVMLQEQRQPADAQPMELDLSRLEKGTYFLTLSSGTFVQTEKVSLY